MSELPLKITKKNGSKKRYRRNLKKLQENLTEVFSASSFSDSVIEEKDDNFGKVADESNGKLRG